MSTLYFFTVEKLVNAQTNLPKRRLIDKWLIIATFYFACFWNLLLYEESQVSNYVFHWDPTDEDLLVTGNIVYMGSMT